MIKFSFFSDVQNTIVTVIYWLIVAVVYIINSVAYYRIAKKRNVSAPILAWFPIVNNWTVGAITDSFDNERGLNRKWRVTLLMLKIAATVMYISFAIILFVSALGIKVIVEQLALSAVTEQQLSQLMLSVIPSIVCLLIGIFISMVHSILTYICIYKIFEGANPKKSVKYILFTFFIPFAFSACLLKCSNMVPSLRMYEEGSVAREFKPKAVKYYKEETDE